MTSPDMPGFIRLSVPPSRPMLTFYQTTASVDLGVLRKPCQPSNSCPLFSGFVRAPFATPPESAADRVRTLWVIEKNPGLV